MFESNRFTVGCDAFGEDWSPECIINYFFSIAVNLYYDNYCIDVDLEDVW